MGENFDGTISRGDQRHHSADGTSAICPAVAADGEDLNAETDANLMSGKERIQSLLALFSSGESSEQNNVKEIETSHALADRKIITQQSTWTKCHGCKEVVLCTMAPSSNTFSLKKLAKRLQKPAQNLLGIGAIGSLIVGGGFLVYACPLALVALAPFAVAGVYSAATRRHSSLTRSSPFLITSNSIDSASDNHYTLLGIQQNATSKEITAAYRKLALECHPDLRKQGKTVDEELFKSICNAYAVLSDPELRQQYNIGGDEAVRCYLAHMRGRPAAETNIQQGWKWNWNLLQSLWWNSQAELPPLSESFRQQYHFYTQLEEAVAMGLPKLPCELVEMLQNNGYSMIANAVQLAISSSFHCSMCNQSIDGRLEGICYCIKRSTQFPHHRNRCCHKPTNLLKKFKKRASTIGSECQSFIYMATKRC